MLALADGELVRTLACEPGHWPPLIHQGTIVFRQPERWSAVSLTPTDEPPAKGGPTRTAKKSEPWEWFITFGGDVRPGMPVVGSAGALFLADEKGGLICVRPTR